MIANADSKLKKGSCDHFVQKFRNSSICDVIARLAYRAYERAIRASYVLDVLLHHKCNIVKQCWEYFEALTVLISDYYFNFENVTTSKIQPYSQRKLTADIGSFY